MRILFLSSAVIASDSRYGGAKRLHAFVTYLRRRHPVTVLCLDTIDERSRCSREGLAGMTVIPVVPNAGLLHRLRAPMIDVWRQLRLRCWDRIGPLLEQQYDCIFVAYPLALSFLGARVIASHPNIVYLEDDLLSESVWEQVRAQRVPWTWAWKLFMYLQLKHYYRVRASVVRALIAITSQERTILTRLLPNRPVYVIKYGLDLASYPLLGASAARPTLGFIGNYAHPPNVDALEYFLGSVLPHIRGRRPDVAVIIAGQSVPSAIRSAFADIPLLEWMEDLPSVRDFYCRVSIVVSPVVTGRGLRTKLVEAAAFGRPIVTTALGAEGLEDLDMYLADSGARAFAEATLRALSEPSERSAQVVANRARVEHEYSIGVVGAALERVLLGEDACTIA